MSRRRWVQVDGELVEVGPDYTPEPRSVKDSTLWNDRVYQDMGDPRFKSRAQHRAYMREKGVTSTSDYKDEWRVREGQRIKERQGYDPSRRLDVERAISQLNSRRK